jgi:UDP-3-O-[3-hydroxymyristoyl] glucosamine N-acyltransferase
MNTQLSAIVEACREAGLVLEGAVPGDCKVTGIAAVQDCGVGDLVFADKPALAAFVLERKPSVVVAARGLRDTLAAASPATIVLLTGQVALAHAFIKQRYAARDFDAAGWEGPIHPSAVVHPTAVIGTGTVIEPRAVVGRNAMIGARCRIMSGAVVEHDARVGDDSIVHPNAVIGYGCRLGNEVVVGAGSVIGAEGFGFAQDAKRRSHPIPQTGIVVIGDRVRIGANNTIDRATYAETRIGSGTKFDNLCHVAHNVEIGEDCLLTAMFCIAGSSRVGNRVIASGQTGIIDHVSVGDDVVLVHRAGVVKDIEQAGVYASLPTQPMDEYLRNTAAARKGAELRRRVADLEQRLEQSQEKNTQQD